MKTNILLVDDQPAKLLSYELILADLDETLVKANSATEALQHLLTTDFAVVLIDVCMPDLDGIEAGASDYLAKPVNTEQLISALRMWLHR
jgi:CheY-like chemotaxis protein